MTRQVVLGVLAGFAALGWSVTAAHAGAGGNPSTLTTFFVCNSISGEAPGEVVNVEPNALGPARDDVKVGKAALACAQTFLHDQDGNLIDPGPGKQELKCYTVSVGKQTGASPSLLQAFDWFFPGGTDVKNSSFQYVCAPASIFAGP
jgi:hypothetical protein